MSRIKFLLLPVGFLLVCGIYANNFSRLHIQGSVQYVPFAKLVNGRADTPFQYRFLIPWLARTSHPYLEHLHLADSIDETKDLFEFSFVFALLGVFIYCSPYLVLNDPQSNIRRNSLVRWAAAWLLMLALPFHYILPLKTYYYPSDIPAILFFVLGLTFLRQKKWSLYYLIFIIGTFNRETTIFLSIVYLLTSWKSTPRHKLAIYFTLQVLTWLAIKILLWWMFKNNASESVWYADAMGMFKYSWSQNLEFLSDPQTIVNLFSVYGYLWIPLIALWKDIRDQWLRPALLTIPLFHLAMLIPGEINELRIYGEMLPLVILGILAGTITNEK
ncbi:MAG: hypothetical protein IH589_17960 [Anaerolineales bacterium]|nr:hypothetical protein [Anaerolineales bacterium]